MMPGGNCNSVSSAAFKVVSLVAGAKVGFYYTFSDSNFATTDKAKPDSLYILDGDGNKLKTFDAIAGKNSEAYYDEYTLNSADTTVYVGSDSRMITFGIVLSQGAVAQEVDVTIKDGDETIKTQSVIQNETLEYAPTKYGFDFAGYFTDSALENEFDVSTPITEAITLYVKWTAWDIAINQNVLDKALIDKVAVVSTDFAGGSLELTGTIYTILKSSQIEASSSSIKTNGGLSPANAEKGISFVAPDDGVLTVEVKSGGSTERNAKLQTLGDNDKYVEVAAASGNATFEAGADKSETDPRVLTYNVESGKTYFFGGSNGLKVYSMSFVGAHEPRMGFHQLAGYNADGVELVRYVAILENIPEADIDGNFSLVLTGEGLGEGFNVTEHCIVATRLTSNGETYAAEIDGAQYEFGVKDNTLYVVCVVAVSNDGAALADQFVGKTITATLTVNGSVVGEALTYTVLGAQA